MPVDRAYAERCRNFCSASSPAVVRAATEAGSHVVVQGVDGVLERLVEDVELGRVGVAVEEEDVVGVHRADGRDEPPVEGPDDAAGLVRGLVQQVVARHPGVAPVVVGDGLPQVHDPVLEVPVLPEGGDVGGVVGVPVMVLGAGQGVQVDDRVDAVSGERVDGPVEVAEAVGLDLERSGVVLEVLVADGDPGQVEPGLPRNAASGSSKNRVSRRSKNRSARSSPMTRRPPAA